MLEGTLAKSRPLAAALGIPALAAWVSPALREETQDWVPVGSLTDPGPGQPDLSPVGVPIATSFTRLVQDAYLSAQPQPVAVFIVNHGDEKFTIFDNRCTHLGCPFNWDEAKGEYVCPCHNGLFDEQGRVTGGPPPRPLDRYAYKVEDGVLYAGELFQVNENLERVTA
jgi:menaquinol-cytochrome c reductase iron-sulfur subunit